MERRELSCTLVGIYIDIDTVENSMNISFKKIKNKTNM